MDVRRGQPRQDAESDRRPRTIRSQAVHHLGEGAFFGYFLCTSKESDSGATAHETLLLLRNNNPHKQRGPRLITPGRTNHQIV
ncbi:hypothetical protein ACVWZN_002333 [Lysobacter sp. HA35]